MKKLTTLAFFASLATSLFATHIIGGSIFYRQIGTSDQYEIRMEIYRDCYTGVPPFDDPASIGVFLPDATLVLEIKVSPNPSDTLDLLNTPLCISASPDICVERAVYLTTVTLPPNSTGYLLLYQRCCRNQLVANYDLPLDSGISITAFVPSVVNSSARLNYSMPYYGFVHKPFIYDASATDLDGDSLVYRLSTAVNGATELNNPMPQPPSFSTMLPMAFASGLFDIDHVLGISQYPLTMNSKTGELKALPEMQGFFVISFEIDEYRNGQFLATAHHEIAVAIFDGSTGLSVSGAVKTDPISPIDAGFHEIFERNPLNDSLLLIQQNETVGGSYQFDGLFSSKYYLRGRPVANSTFAGLFFPTFHPSNIFWYNAAEVEVCVFSSTDIDILLRADSLQLIGSGIISGLLQKPGGGPVPGIEIWLMTDEPNPQPVRFTTTDASGNFWLSNLPGGNFQLFVNEPNTLIFNEFPPEIDLPGDPANVQINVVLEWQIDRLKLLSVGQSEPSEFRKMAISPNPAGHEIRVELPVGQAVLSVKITDAAGQLVLFEKTLFENEIARFDVENLPPGVFFVEAETTAGRAIGRFVK